MEAIFKCGHRPDQTGRGREPYSPSDPMKILGLIALGGMFLAGCATPQVAVNAHADFSRIHRVAVASFSGAGGDVAADLMTQDLLQHGADVVERQRLDALLQEQNLASQNILDPTTIKKIGKILGVDAIFVGTVANNVPSQSYLDRKSTR